MLRRPPLKGLDAFMTRSFLTDVHNLILEQALLRESLLEFGTKKT